ncbi:MAG: glucose-6-phosphate dehydrogenase [Victivallales bacterium]|nr:glucose-6-phosphate dehydrogenase [Victivallales bacterium]
MKKDLKNLDIVVLGASGNLAQTKIFPALFALFSQGLLPEKVKFYGFARSQLSQTEFKEQIMPNLTCRYTPDHSCGDFVEKFLERSYYCNGKYDSIDGLNSLASHLTKDANRIFYMALPPEIFPMLTKSIAMAGLLGSDADKWVRVVIEKPFGRDRASSDELNSELLKEFSEKQIYRIDHYLGKEMVQNIMVLRFANQIFKPLWNSKYIKCVEIDWQENIGVEGRGGYFDNYGIIRDVVQNHLLQLVTLVAMDEPESLDADVIRDRKLAVLHDIEIVNIEDLILGQYTNYTDDPMVPDKSLTPTFVNVKLKIDNAEWRDVPFVIRAGKGLNAKKNEIRILFRKPEGNIFCQLDNCPPANELIIRIQPDEGIHFNIVSKVPGLKMQFQEKDLDLSYKSAFGDAIIPEAYESLLLDVINGEKALFIRNDELEAAWDIFTPVLRYIEENKIKPENYVFGSKGFDRICKKE